MPKIKEGTPIRLSDSLGRKLRVGDTIKNIESGKEYVVVSTNTAKSTKDAEQLDLAKKHGLVQAMFQTVRTWDEGTEATQSEKLAKLQRDYDSLNTTFHKCKDELDALKDTHANCMDSLDKALAEKAGLVERIESLNDMIAKISLKSSEETPDESLSAELEALRAQAESDADEIKTLTDHETQLHLTIDKLTKENEELQKELEACSLRGQVFDACGVPKCLADATTQALIDELRIRGVRGSLRVPQTVWTKYSLDDEKAGE